MKNNFIFYLNHKKKENNMYINAKPELEKILLERNKNKKEIQKKIEAWVENNFGIPDFFSFFEKTTGIMRTGEVISVLPRHINSLNIESISFLLLSEKIKTKPYLISFEEDNFSSSNSSKAGCVKMQFIQREKGGKIVKRKKIIVDQKLGDLEGIPLNMIKTSKEKSLVNFHKEIINNVFPCELADISLFIRESFLMAVKKNKIPDSTIVFEIENGRWKKKKFKDVIDLEAVRPSMGWYYPLIFNLLIIDIVFFETYREDPVAEKEFERAVRTINENIGYSPMIIEIPPSVEVEKYKSNLFEYKEAFTKDKEGMQEFVKETKEINSDNLLEMFEEIAKKALTFKI